MKPLSAALVLICAGWVALVSWVLTRPVVHPEVVSQTVVQPIYVPYGPTAPDRFRACVPEFYELIDQQGTKPITAERGSIEICSLLLQVRGGNADLQLVECKNNKPVWPKEGPYNLRNDTALTVGEIQVRSVTPLCLQQTGRAQVSGGLQYRRVEHAR